jgi:hypothetical protein
MTRRALLWFGTCLALSAGGAPPSLSAAHAQADADGDGLLTQGELVSLLHDTWHAHTKTALRAMPRDAAKFFLMPLFGDPADRDGGASLDDVRAHSGELHLERFAAADADANGKVTSAELKSHLWEVMAASAGGGPVKMHKATLIADVRALFASADRDGDGVLSLPELKEVPESAVGGTITSLLSMGSSDKAAKPPSKEDGGEERDNADLVAAAEARAAAAAMAKAEAAEEAAAAAEAAVAAEATAVAAEDDARAAAQSDSSAPAGPAADQGYQEERGVVGEPIA